MSQLVGDMRMVFLNPQAVKDDTAIEKRLGDYRKRAYQANPEV